MSAQLPPFDFDFSKTSVAPLHNFLNDTPVLTVRESLIRLLPHYRNPELTLDVLDDMLTANGEEVKLICIVGLTDLEQKLAIRMYTAEEPYPLYRGFNEPFISMVNAQQHSKSHVCENNEIILFAESQQRAAARSCTVHKASPACNSLPFASN